MPEHCFVMLSRAAVACQELYLAIFKVLNEPFFRLGVFIRYFTLPFNVLYSEPGQPLTAPENIPLISCLCPAMKTEIDGTIIMTTPAIIMEMDCESTLSSIPMPI